MPKPDLVAEHAALTAEKAEIQRLVLEEFATMFHTVARERALRLAAIDARLANIERSKAWKGRASG